MGKANKGLFIAGLLAVIVIMGVGYAAFSTNLNINGTASIESNWDVHIKDIKAQPSTTGATDIAESTKVSDENGLAATFGTNLVSPGDSLTYDVTVVNAGTLDAELTDMTFKQTNTGTGATTEGGDPVASTGTAAGGDFATDTAASNPITFSVSGIQTGDVLKAANDTDSDEVTFHVTVTYNNAITAQPTEAQLKSALTMVLSFGQKTTE